MESKKKIKSKQPMFQLWQHRKDNPNTWKYKDCIIKENKFIRYVLNPDFIYKHLDPNWPKDKIVEGI